ncbi:unnamed protein product [Bemisia tabaci]|uniref:Envelope protein n=1 Tax=Bemisia tabaci TaxID=7038 RepID=A0A9P0G4Q7_BEMTA|nr:unnamed protein product [Bemisia tabaci]
MKAPGLPILAAVMALWQGGLACTTIKNSTVISFNSTKQALFKNGVVTIPLVIDLIYPYKVCNEVYHSSVLAGMFRSAGTPPPSRNYEAKSRQKRALPLLITGAVATSSSVATLATMLWAKLKYAELNGEIEKLRQDLGRRTSYLEKLTVENKEANIKNYIAIRRDLKQITTLMSENLCKLENYTRIILLESQMLNEFDEIMAALRTKTLSAKLLPPSQLHAFIENSPPLHNTLYTQAPYLLYLLAEVSFDLEEIKMSDGSILRGVITVPLIVRNEKVTTEIAAKRYDDTIKVFRPVQVAQESLRSVEHCDEQPDFFVCTEADLTDVLFKEVTDKMIFDKGIVVVTQNNTAMVNKEENGAKTQILGPAICSQENAHSVTFENKLIFTHSNMFHVKHIEYELHQVPYDVTLQLNDDELKELKEKLETLADNSEPQKLAHYTVTIILAITTTLALAYICKKQRSQTRVVKQLEQRGLELNEILVVQEGNEGSRRGRLVRA